VGDGQSDDIEVSDPAAAPEADPDPRRPARNPRQQRARRRRHRRQLGTLIFLAVAAAVFAAAYFTLAGGDDSSDDAKTATTAAGATTTSAPFSAPYNVTTGVNVRQGAGTSFATVGTVETGKPVTVVCVAQGEPVNGPNGANPQWLKVSAPPPGGYVSAVYVAVGDDLTNKKIPACPPA
jgi:hypothetical protein